MTPTELSLRRLRAMGYSAHVAERYISFAKFRKDLAGFIDIVAFGAGQTGVLGVQTTTGSNVSSRIQKILAIEDARIWLQAQNRIEVHGWTKRGPRGKKKLWTPRILAVVLDPITGELVTMDESAAVGANPRRRNCHAAQ